MSRTRVLVSILGMSGQMQSGKCILHAEQRSTEEASQFNSVASRLETPNWRVRLQRFRRKRCSREPLTKCDVTVRRVNTVLSAQVGTAGRTGRRLHRVNVFER